VALLSQKNLKIKFENLLTCGVALLSQKNLKIK